MISNERKKYLLKKKRKKFSILIIQILILVIFVSLWEILANLKIIDSFITSQPSRVIRTISNLSSNGLLLHLGITCFETILGFVIGTILGTILAIILWWSDYLSKVFEPFLVVLNSLPKIALGPIIIIWVGAGMSAIVTMALAISLIVTVLEMLNGFTNTDKNRIKMVKTFNANKFQIFSKIVFPSNISTLISALKVNIGLSLVGVISGEFLVSKAGIGYLIVYGGQVFQLDLVMSSVIILGLVAALMYQAVLLLEKFILRLMTHTR
jgi:NitT/TauT family transport system permease protein